MPACLPDQSVVLPDGAMSPAGVDSPPADLCLTSCGWLPVVGHDTCSQPDWWSILATDKMVCAGGDGITAGYNGDWWPSELPEP
ncbi:chymotrypsin-C-like [Micropterus salmoides]|uniref:chymotrypsin-C-like n=1 Tax=Micropterus salmoides TaxID=27706 RepID=UPI0018ED169C|nr:chymotrypsin-C-like [Micropterus salmoides]